jgi:iron only hydrogenase large subunit-like protein
MSVFISNLDDFIAPGAACVNPLVLGKSSKEEDGAGREMKATPNGLQQGESASSGGLRIELGQGLEYESHIPPILAGEANLIRNKVSTSSSGSASKVATISLNDCLACSGCVTSAESVLIEQQSANKLINKLAEQQAGDSGDIVVVAMSPQSRAAIASRLGISSGEAFLRIASVLKGMGVRYVVDVASAADIALIEAREEFLLRHRLSSGTPAATQGNSNSKAYWEKPPTTVAHSATRLKVIPPNASAQDFEQLQPTYVGAPPLPSSSSSSSSSTAQASSGENVMRMRDGDHNVTMPMPMIVSSCPGWVCYAEKTQPQVLPYMSSVKSAQQILGRLLKRQLGVTGTNGIGSGSGSEGNGDNSGNVSTSSTSSSGGGGGKRLFLVSIQPCFDKKLEASRLDFYDEEAAQADVDLVRISLFYVLPPFFLFLLVVSLPFSLLSIYYCLPAFSDTI